MSTLAHAAPRPRVLFVDDEQRVLNSMRIMFRRQFDLYLASHGAEALNIVKDKEIDVIVADHRMPQMTGVEVLTHVRKLSPRTVRILLTGYADLDAVEGSINHGEVFRFLTKPCAPKQLRDTVELAAKLSRTAPAVPAAAEGGQDLDDEAATATPTTTGDRTVKAMTAANTPRPAPSRAGLAKPTAIGAGLGVTVLSSDEEMVAVVERAVRGGLPVHHAGNIAQVIEVLHAQKPGVLITDISNDKQTIQSMTARLKQHLPELVTIVVSPHRDVRDMVWLINHGQIFRFLRKPLSPGRCGVSLQAALHHHRMLLANPGLVKRHQVEVVTDAGLKESVLSKLRSMKRLWTAA